MTITYDVTDLHSGMVAFETTSRVEALIFARHLVLRAGGRMPTPEETAKATADTIAWCDAHGLRVDMSATVWVACDDNGHATAIIDTACRLWCAMAH